MPLWEDPRGQMHFDVERISLARFKIVGFSHRITLCAVYSGTGNLSDGSIGSHIGETSEPIGLFGGGRGLQQRMRTAEDGHFIFQWRGIVDQTERIHGARIT